MTALLAFAIACTLVCFCAAIAAADMRDRPWWAWYAIVPGFIVSVTLIGVAAMGIS